MKSAFLVTGKLGQPGAASARGRAPACLENPMRPSNLAYAAVAAAALALAAPSFAQHPEGAHVAATPPKSANLQGPDAGQAWRSDVHMKQFYDLSVASLGKGTDHADVDAYEQKAYAIFRDFAPTMHMTPDQMQDHLKLIPRQMVKIVHDDPKVLDSLANFEDALFGPQ
jgi:hypothetical protein